MTQQSNLVPLQQLFRLDGKAAIVTGGAMGIGRGIVRRLAEAGAAVTIGDVNMEAAERAASEERHQGRKAIAVRCDVSQEADVRTLVSRTVEEFGQVDVLVNNAGIFPFKPTLEMSVEEWDQVQAINLRGAFLCSREFSKQAVSQGGRGAIVNIGSIDSLHPSSAGLAAYDASKGGMLMFTKSFALEAASLGIRVNMVAPGGITTEGTTAGSMGMTPEQQAAVMQAFVAKIPIGRMGIPDDIAVATLFLATEASSYTTGETVVVDGGRLLA